MPLHDICCVNCRRNDSAIIETTKETEHMIRMLVILKLSRLSIFGEIHLMSPKFF